MEAPSDVIVPETLMTGLSFKLARMSVADFVLALSMIFPQ